MPSRRTKPNRSRHPSRSRRAPRASGQETEPALAVVTMFPPPAIIVGSSVEVAIAGDTPSDEPRGWICCSPWLPADDVAGMGIDKPCWNAAAR